MKRIGTIVLAFAIICLSISFFGYGGNVMATVTKGGQFEQIVYSSVEFKLEAGGDIIALKNSYDGESFYYQLNREDYKADIYRFFIDENRSELVLEDVSQVTNPGVADDYIVGWKGFESGRKSIFLYSTETGVTTLLPAYEEGKYQQINGFKNGKLLFRKCYLQTQGTETLHIFDVLTGETKTIYEDTQTIASSSLRFNDKYVIYLRYPTELLIYDIEKEELVDFRKRGIDAENSRITLSGEYLFFASDQLEGNSLRRLSSSSYPILCSKLMTYHIPTGRIDQINDMGQIISHPTVFPDESIYYTSCMRNDAELTDVFKISTGDKVEEELFKVDGISNKSILSANENWFSVYKTEETSYLLEIYNTMDKTFCSLDFDRDDLHFNIKQSRRAIVQWNDEEFMILNYPDGEKNTLVGTIYSK